MESPSLLTQEQKIKFWSFVIAIVLVGGGFMWLRNKFNEEANAPYKPNKMDAIIYSEEYVKNRLKAPATADFPVAIDAHANQIDDSTFYVHSYVDAQNGFGANIRSNYTCTMIFFSNNTHICKNLIME